MIEKDLSKPLFLERFNNVGGYTFENYPYFYKPALEGMKNENDFEKKLRAYCESIHKIDLPYCVKWVTRKRAKNVGCYSLKGSTIELFQANLLDLYDKNKIDIKKAETFMLHEYAHLVKNWICRWDNEMHGVVFESVLFNLRKLAKTKGLYYAALDVDNDYFHNRMKKNIVFEPVCERMGLDPKVMLNDNDVIVTDNPNKLVYIY